MIGAILSFVLGLPVIPAPYLANVGINAYSQGEMAGQAWICMIYPELGAMAVSAVVADAGPASHCYDFGEAHNELTLPCVTIEP